MPYFDTFADSYDRHARLLPGLLVLLPLGLLAAAYFPNHFAALGVVVGIVGTCGGAALLVEVVREAGKDKEVSLFESWGGMPTTVLLRHRGHAPDANRMRWHQRLSALDADLSLPSADDEERDPDAADALYAEAVRRLRERTRSTDASTLLRRENRAYGYRRNAWAVKPAGITTAAIGVLMAGAQLGRSTSGGGQSEPFVILAALVCVMLLTFWLVVVRANWVRRQAYRYAEHLLGALERL